jgi:ATP-dependent DNA helicase DinG
MSWNETQASFARSLPNYEPRAEQTRLAEAIEATLASGEHLAAQAGTGTGKSLAGLVPAIEHAVKTGVPAIIATATKALQTQYAAKDLPFLEENLDVPFTWALLKGRANYVCRAKLAELAPGSVANQDALVTELLAEDHSGDLEDLSTAIDPQQQRKLVSSSDECPGKANCPFGEICFAEIAKTKARQSNVVLVNHSVLATDLIIRQAQIDNEPTKEPKSLLPTFGAVILDEGHEFETYMAGAMSNEFSERGLNFFASEVNNYLGAANTVVAPFNGAVKRLFTVLARRLDREENVRLTRADVMALEGEMGGLLSTVRAIQEAIAAKDIDGNDKGKIKKARLVRRAESTQERILSVLGAGVEMIRWLERDKKHGDVRLKFSPLSVAEFVNRALWEQHTGVLLSATLAVGRDYSFVTGNVGLSEYVPFDAGSPFDYPKQASLFVPKDMIDPTPRNAARWRVQAQAEMRKLVLAAGGRALLLFSATTAMDEAHQALAPTFEAAGLTVFKQNGPLTNRQIAAAFKADETSVLFGVASFATGFDVQGDALRLVVLDKLPFANPGDVVYDAKCDALNTQHGNKWAFFNKLAVPAMALKLFQGFGRLIRSKSDEGMVAILDSRLVSKPYGKTIMNALPPARRVFTSEEAVSYLDELTARRG